MITEKYRSGDPVRIEPNVVDNAGAKGKGKKKADEDENAVEGVVYRASPSFPSFILGSMSGDVSVLTIRYPQRK